MLLLSPARRRLRRLPDGHLRRRPSLQNARPSPITIYDAYAITITAVGRCVCSQEVCRRIVRRRTKTFADWRRFGMDNDAMTSQATSGPSELLFGRDAELRILEQRLDSVGENGSALLVRGDPGVGKTSVLAAAKKLASERRLAVLSTAGVQTETNLPFAGLFELVRPIIDKIESLPKAQQNALRAAFGLVERSSADLFVVALGALDLLAEAASERPLLVVIDDVQWLDQSSVAVF